MLVDSWYDPYLGVVILVRVIDGIDEEGPADQVHAGGDDASGRPRGVLPPQDRAARRAGAGRDRLHHRADQGRGAGARRRYADRCQAPDRTGAGGVQGSPAGGVLRVVSGRCQRLREASRVDLEASAQRCQLQLRDGDERRAGVRLPLRIPGAAPPRDHPGAADARIRPRPDHHRAVGGVRDRADASRAGGRGASGAAQSRRHARSQQDRLDRRTVDRGDDLRPRRISRQHPEAVPGPARASRRT